MNWHNFKEIYAKRRESQGKREVQQKADVPENKSSEKRVIRWKKRGFDLKKELLSIGGYFIEVGGPTPRGYTLANPKELGIRLYVSNLFPVIRFPVIGRFPGVQEEKVDFQADARCLPCKNSSIGAVFMSCLSMCKESSEYNKKLKEKAIQEAFRALKSGGFLMWEGIKPNWKLAKELGFEVVQCSIVNKKVYCVAFKKTIV